VDACEVKKDGKSQGYVVVGDPDGIRSRRHMPGGREVGVGLPKRPYLESTSCRIAPAVAPCPLMRITSRVMSRQMLQVAAWLVKVTVSAVSCLM
jgi:hypothetical protein